MNKEINRLQTFEEINSDYIKLYALSGLYIIFDDGIIINCAFCKFTKKFFKLNMNIIINHFFHLPRCLLLTQKKTNNKPVNVTEFNILLKRCINVNREQLFIQRNLIFTNLFIPQYISNEKHVSRFRFVLNKKLKIELEQSLKLVTLKDLKCSKINLLQNINNYIENGSILHKNDIYGFLQYEYRVQQIIRYYKDNYTTFIELQTNFLNQKITDKNFIFSIYNNFINCLFCENQIINKGRNNKMWKNHSQESKKCPFKPMNIVDDDTSNCHICMEKPISQIFIPCGHYAVCNNCIIKIKNCYNRCPICNENIISTQNIFFP